MYSVAGGVWTMGLVRCRGEVLACPLFFFSLIAATVTGHRIIKPDKWARWAPAIFPPLQLKVHHISLKPPNKVVRNTFLTQIDLDALQRVCLWCNSRLGGRCSCGFNCDGLAPEAMAVQAIKQVIFIKTESQSCFILLG